MLLWSKLQLQSAGAIRLTTSGILRSNSKCTLWPGDYLELFAPQGFEDDQALAIEPRTKMAPQISESWPSPGIVTSVAGKIRIPNSLNVPLSLKHHEHIGQVCRTFDPLATPSITTCTPNSAPNSTSNTTLPSQKTPATHHFSPIRLDPDQILPANIVQQFTDLHTEFNTLFDPDFPRYNGAAGPIKAVVNMGPVQPPQR